MSFIRYPAAELWFAELCYHWMCELDYDWILICSKSLQCATLNWVRHGRSQIWNYDLLCKGPITSWLLNSFYCLQNISKCNFYLTYSYLCLIFRLLLLKAIDYLWCVCICNSSHNNIPNGSQGERNGKLKVLCIRPLKIRNILKHSREIIHFNKWTNMWIWAHRSTLKTTNVWNINLKINMKLWIRAQSECMVVSA